MKIFAPVVVKRSVVRHCTTTAVCLDQRQKFLLKALAVISAEFTEKVVRALEGVLNAQQEGYRKFIKELYA